MESEAFANALIAEMRRHIARMTELLAELDASVERRAAVR